MNTLGQNIASHRKEKGITQEQLAEICLVSPQAVSKWENGLSCPDITLLKPIARAFGITVDKLLDDGSAPTVSLSESEIVRGKLLKIRIISKDEKVNINLPIPLIELLLKSGSISDALKLNGKENTIKSIDFEKVLEMVSLGVLGKIIEIESNDGESVEVFIE